MNFYSIRHLTRFRYTRPVSESIMEVRMHPRTDAAQHCLSFSLAVSPRCRVFSYRDQYGNDVQHFDIPGEHAQLVILAESLIEQHPAEPLPSALPFSAWDDLAELIEGGDYGEMLLPSQFTHPSGALKQLAAELRISRRDDPLTLARELNHALYQYFEYVPRSTRVDSPIDEAILSRKGVCQDFAHTMIALLRLQGIPARYVSGYLYRGSGDHDRSTPDATHAWVEAQLPGLDWVGFDPTNDLLAGPRHIRTAIGRDYSDVPPTHGIFRGNAESELYVAVQVEASSSAPVLDRRQHVPDDWTVLVERAREAPPRPTPLASAQIVQQQQ